MTSSHISLVRLQRLLIPLLSLSVLVACGSPEEGEQAPPSMGGQTAEGGRAPTPEGGETVTPEGGEAVTPVGGETVTPEGGQTPEPSSCPAGLPWIEIPTRFHLLSSSIDSLNATLSEAQLRETLAEAQLYLDQACIKVRVERVVRDEVGAERERRFSEVLASNPSNEAFRAMMVDVIPREKLLSPGWNIMVFKAFERFTSGVYLTDIPSVLWAEQLPAVAGGAPNPPLILAHEIGHALGLLHYEGPGIERNLMCQEVIQNKETASELNEEQVARARQQAESGQTFLP